MKQGIQKRFTFFGKSMLWSLLLYVVMMLAINWDEVRNAVNGNKAIVVENTSLPGSQAPIITNPSAVQPNISGHARVMTTIMTLVKTLSGITSKAIAY